LQNSPEAYMLWLTRAESELRATLLHNQKESPINARWAPAERTSINGPIGSGNHTAQMGVGGRLPVGVAQTALAELAVS
jgi:hypothetical protein